MACNHEGAYDRRKNQYEKIVNLYMLTKELASLANTQDLSKTLDQNIGIVPLGEFEKTVDLTSPHMWLEQRVNIVEARLAYVLKQLVNEDKFDKALSLTKKYASNNAKNNFSSLEEAFNYYTLNVLDGMPCDETKEIIENSDNKLVWNKLEDLHEQFYVALNFDVNYYYQFLKAYVDGLFINSNIKFIIENNQKFILTR